MSNDLYRNMLPRPAERSSALECRYQRLHTRSLGFSEKIKGSKAAKVADADRSIYELAKTISRYHHQATPPASHHRAHRSSCALNPLDRPCPRITAPRQQTTTHDGAPGRPVHVTLPLSTIRSVGPAMLPEPSRPDEGCLVRWSPRLC